MESSAQGIGLDYIRRYISTSASSNSTPNVRSLSLWKIFDRSSSIYSR